MIIMNTSDDNDNTLVEVLWAAFESFDLDMDGSLSRDEIMKASAWHRHRRREHCMNLLVVDTFDSIRHLLMNLVNCKYLQTCLMLVAARAQMKWTTKRACKILVPVKRNTPPDKNTGWKISFENTKSVAGLQFLPLGRMAKARAKGMFISALKYENGELAKYFGLWSQRWTKTAQSFDMCRASSPSRPSEPSYVTLYDI